MKKLDKYQMNVVTALSDTLVIAGPGSGKTSTIIEKVNFLLKTNNPQDILMLSFTNKSVEDIKKRLDANIRVMTFHKLAIDILKYNNYSYKLCSPNLLDYIIDEQFLSMDKKSTNRLCRYLNIAKFSIHSFEYQSLKKLIKTFIYLFKTNNHNIENLHNMITNYQDKYLIKIILHILRSYEEEKNSNKTLDFDDLITTATKILKTKYNYHHFKYIIVDEFQDTSLIRLYLLKIIYDASKSIITAVGDDAQSIFHFSGCDLKIFLNFKNYFPHSKLIYLKNTYRNSQELINISSAFINKNPNQITKNMQSELHIHNPIQIIKYFNPKKSFKKLLNSLLKDSKEIMILGRNQYDIYEYLDDKFKLDNNILYYQNYKIPYLTIHSAKGLESDFVIILNVSNKLYGIPNKLESHEILKYTQNNLDDFPFAEERRIFFVALTRCRFKTFLLVPFDNPSCFIKEIKKLL